MGRGGGRFRSPPQNAVNGNGHANLEEKLANLSITEVSQFTASFFPSTFSRDTFFILCRTATAITRLAREAVVVRRLPSVASAVPTVHMRVLPSQHPPRRSNVCPTQMNFPSLVAHPPPLRSTGMSPTRDRRPHKYYKHLPFARTHQSRTLRLWWLKDRNSSGPSLVRYVFPSVGAPRDILMTIFYLIRRPSKPPLRTLRHRHRLLYPHFLTSSLCPLLLLPMVRPIPRRRFQSRHRSPYCDHTYYACFFFFARIDPRPCFFFRTIRLPTSPSRSCNTLTTTRAPSRLYVSLSVHPSVCCF